MTTLEKEEAAHLRTIDERDAAEECLSQMFYLVTGRNPEWSNVFGHEQALEEVSDAMALLKASVPRPAPDWPPQTSAIGLAKGEQRRGSTGQLFEARNGQWVRLLRDE